MNARASPAGGTLPPPPDVCHRLERRLRRETRGEVLFDPAARGRYATDASIYQIWPVGVFVPRDERDVATAIDIARDCTYRFSHAAPAPASAARRSARRWSSTSASTCGAFSTSIPPARTPWSSRVSFSMS